MQSRAKGVSGGDVSDFDETKETEKKTFFFSPLALRSLSLSKRWKPTLRLSLESPLRHSRLSVAVHSGLILPHSCGVESGRKRAWRGWRGREMLFEDANGKSRPLFFFLRRQPPLLSLFSPSEKKKNAPSPLPLATSPLSPLLSPPIHQPPGPVQEERRRLPQGLFLPPRPSSSPSLLPQGRRRRGRLGREHLVIGADHLCQQVPHGQEGLRLPLR